MEEMNHWMFDSEEGAWFIKRFFFIFMTTFVLVYAAMWLTVSFAKDVEVIDIDYDPTYNLNGSHAVLYRYSGYIEYYTDGELFTYMELDPRSIEVPHMEYANTIFAYFAEHDLLKVVVAHRVIVTIDTTQCLDLEYDLGSEFPVTIIDR